MSASKKESRKQSLSFLLNGYSNTSSNHEYNIGTPYIISSITHRRCQSSFSTSILTKASQLLTISTLICLLLPSFISCVDPKFDPSTRMRLVLVPSDAQVGSVIYRLRATDEEFDYPLTFELIGDASASTVKIESLPCTKYNSVCQANVILQRRLESGRYYDFQVSVKDTKGGMTTQLCSITATNFTTPNDLIFPHKPGIIKISEDAKRGTELDYVIARKNPLFQKPVYLELWGSSLFAIRQKIVSPETTEGTIFLLGPLDFEKQAMYHLVILANDAYAEPGQDSRNIAGLEIVVVVQDVQDQPPVFTLAPPVTKLPLGILPGDKILKIHAEDGDKGNPREIRYGLVSEGNPFTSFFDINETSGEIFLMRPLEDIVAITHVGDPVLLTVIAEEVKTGRDEPPVMASTVQLAFLLPERTNSPPYFENDHYISRVDENAPQGTAITFVDPYVPRVYDDDSGKNGVFSLTLLNNNGTFELSPTVAERSTSFLIRVRDNTFLDYEERHSVQFQIIAQELGPATNLSATVNVTVYINDVNDNPPVFTQTVYSIEMPENITVGTKIVQVHADDVDTGVGGRVRYTAILGYLNTSLNLDAENGVITISTNNHGFDREVMPEFHLYVEARDNDGTGNRVQVPLVIKLIDVNDETPIFDKDLYEFILAPDLKTFTSEAVIHATDKDATAPNNEVRYEIINGNYENKFALHRVTGQLTVLEKIDLPSKRIAQVTSMRNRRQAPNSDMSTLLSYNDIFVITARAYDLGVPVRFSTTTVRIYPPESRTRTVTFVVPERNPDKAKTEETLSAITGGKVIIHEVRPLQLDDHNVKNSSDAHGGQQRSVITATVLYDSSSVVDVSEIQNRLSQHNSSYTIMTQNANETDNITSLHTLYKAENKVLFWLLILLATLVALTILILLLCCICSWCPLYGSASKRIVNISRTEDDVHLVHREMANGKQTKSIQVADWMGRREAWSADKPPDSRTKPTRWEFHDGRGQLEENLVVHDGVTEEQRRIRSAEEQQRRVRIKNAITAKDDTHLNFHNSRTNLINDRDVFIEDMVDDQNFVDEHIRRGRIQRQMSQQMHRKRYDSDGQQNANADADSMRKHEIDRGSDMDFNTVRSSLKNKREFFIKDGNVEILQLMTRDKTRDGAGVDDQNMYANVPLKSTGLSHPQLLMVDNSGKEILMRRFIEEQPDGKQIIREHYQIVPGSTYIQAMPNEVQTTNLKGETFLLGRSGPNSIVYSQTEPEVKVIHTQPTQLMQPSLSNQSLTQELENSLKHQSELLRQILLDKEKSQTKYFQQEVILETQSLPGQSVVAIATQTDCDAGTQTDVDPQNVQRSTTNSSKKSNIRRRARSENDDSLSEDEYDDVRFVQNTPEGVYWIKRRRQRRRAKDRGGRHPQRRLIMVEEVKRKIRTPIKEEDDYISDYENHKRSPPQKPIRRTTTTKKTSNPRSDRKFDNKDTDGAKQHSEALNREVLMQIADSLNSKNGSAEQRRHKIRLKRVDYYDYSEDNDDLRNTNSDQCCSNDSDTDEIVIRTNSFTPDIKTKLKKQYKPKANEREVYEIHLDDEDSEVEIYGMHDLQEHLSLSEGKDNMSEKKVRLSRRDNKTSQNKMRTETSSEPPNNRIPLAKEGANKKNSEVNFESRENDEISTRERAYQSETDLTNRGETRTEQNSRSVPKYMEWYYGNKGTSKSRTSSSVDPSNLQASTKRRKMVAEKNLPRKKISKTQINVNSDNALNDIQDSKYKPEPAPRKSTPKVSRLLKEDIAMNKTHKPLIETDTNHPLLQHSAHRFEREHVHEVPVAPTKLPHYMYPETPPFATSSKDFTDQTINKQRPKPSPIKENEVKVTSSKIHLYINNPNSVQSQASTATSSVHNAQKLNASTLEDDHDSGIAMNSLLNTMGRRNPIAEKKSVFSIAYDDISRVKNITSGGESSQYS